MVPLSAGNIGEGCQDGILLLDKPEGMTSNGALQRAKRLLGLKKAGHTGSLDPMATGLLVLLFGEATKIAHFILNADKVYRARFRLGIRTNTGDREGEVVGRAPVQVTAEQVAAVLQRFRGSIDQVPPMFSAIKQGGKPLYILARQGVEVAREARRVEIYRLDLLELGADHMDLEIASSKGTYIRSLAMDIGEALGCGAHVETLRRLATGPFRVDEACRLEDLAEMREAGRCPLLPTDRALGHLPAVSLTEGTAYYLLQGQAVLVPRLPPPGEVRLYGPGDRFLGLGEVLDDGRVAPRRLLRVK